MKPTKEHILEYLHELKTELREDGISQIGLFGSYARGKILSIATSTLLSKKMMDTYCIGALMTISMKSSQSNSASRCL